MFREATGVQKIVLVTGRTDFRKGIDSLAAMIRFDYKLNPLDGTLFLFCGKKRDRIKGLLYEQGGYLLLYKRLSSGHYEWPRNKDEALALDRAAFERLMDGYTVVSSIRYPKVKKEKGD